MSQLYELDSFDQKSFPSSIAGSCALHINDCKGAPKGLDAQIRYPPATMDRVNIETTHDCPSHSLVEYDGLNLSLILVEWSLLSF